MLSAGAPRSSTPTPSWVTESGITNAFDTTWYKDGGPTEGVTWANKIAVGIVNARLSAYLYYWEGSELGNLQSDSHLVDTLDGATATPSANFWAFAMWSPPHPPGRRTPRHLRHRRRRPHRRRPQRRWLRRPRPHQQRRRRAARNRACTHTHTHTHILPWASRGPDVYNFFVSLLTHIFFISPGPVFYASTA
ncbi:hypothetical protein LY76DRAFT_419394 [Colletotrichum caudatum]|nr:hypothetical protein LY76DRAFT_419394 [Colletotrichum caudatum]